MDTQVFVPLIGSFIGTVITVLSFYQANKKDGQYEQERRVVEAETRTKQHTETSMKLDAILANHSRLEKEVVGLVIRVGNVEDQLIKSDTQREHSLTRIERIERKMDI